MRAHIIENGIVVNTIEVESMDFMPGLISGDIGGIGWRYDGANLIEPAPLAPTRDQLKAARNAIVAAIKVTTQAGNTFNGDEVAQDRMVRAIVAMQATGIVSINWTLADNTSVSVSPAELVEALALAGVAQSAIWVV